MLHGNLWFAICEEPEKIADAIHQTIEQSSLAEFQPEDAVGGPKLRYLVTPPQPLGAVTLLEETSESNDIVSIIPLVGNLADNELEILSTEPVQDEDFSAIEGVVTAITSDGAEVPFFCPQWLAIQPFIGHGGRFQIGLGALAYSLEPAPAELEFTEGSFFESEKRRRMTEDPDFDPSNFTSVTVRTDTLRTMIRRDDGDFEFQSVVEDAAPFEGLGASGYSMLLNFSPSDRQPIFARVLASAKVLGDYKPMVGDPVRGVAFLQGTLGEKIEAADSWLDSAEAAHAGDNASFFAMANFIFGNPHLPCAVCAVGAALVGAGWEILAIEDVLFREWAPTFVAKRRDDEFWIFVRSAICGFSEVEPFPDNREKVIEYTSARQTRCLWVTVTLESVGRNFAMSTDGFEEFAEELRLPLEMAKPEHFAVVKLDAEGPEPEPMLDEAVAAAVFAECITQRNLQGLSKLLVEDFQFVSDTAHVTILGRQPFLSYLGTKLEGWMEKGQPATASASTVAYGGTLRPCAISQAADGTLINAVVFTGRRGHIERIHAIPAP